MKDEIKNIGFVGILLVVIVGLIAISFLESNAEYVENQKVKSFSSYSELQEFLEKNAGESYYGAFEKSAIPDVARITEQGAAADSGGSTTSTDYSGTNVQVQGVDEADIVKNDGKYIYTIVENKVVVTDAFPAEYMKIVSEIEFKDKNVLEIFINDDTLIVFSQGYAYASLDENAAQAESKRAVTGIGIVPPYYSGQSETHVSLYDIKDRRNPILQKEIVIDGDYIDSRMIDDYVYIVGSQYVQREGPVLPVYSVDGVEKSIAPSEIYYFDYYDKNYVFNTIGAINLENGDFESRVYLIGATNTLYVSQNTIYLTHTKTISPGEYQERYVREALMPLLPEDEKDRVENIMESNKGLNEKVSEINEIIRDYSGSLAGEEKAEFDKELYNAIDDFNIKIQRENQKTGIHKIGVDEMEIDYIGSGEVFGTVLNQFSMDEYNGYFRIATTSGEFWNGNSENNLYVLDSDLKVIGKIEKLAPGEKIYSARFLGDRAYLVTFKKVDPFYVIDLRNAAEPKVLGYLKIPGYSDYLHPYDENHIIGIGKEAVDASEGESFGRDFAWYQGLKIAIFDVSDVSNPRESAKIAIGDRGTDSLALYEHKAFLFDRDKNLLVLPVTLAEIDESKYLGEIPAYAYGETVWSGAYVFDISKDRIEIKGKITHSDDVKKYGPARDDPVGAERKDMQGNVWVKTVEDTWKMQGTEGYVGFLDDSMMDYQYGGIYYNHWYDYRYHIQRSLYMDDILYTISQGKIKANNLDTIEERGKIDLPISQEYYGGPVLY